MSIRLGLSSTVYTYLLVGIRSALPASSVAISRKSRIWLLRAPSPDRLVIVERIQSGHLEGWLGTSLKASEQI